MKRALLLLAAVCLFAGMVGCAHDKPYCGPNCLNGSCAACPETCGTCPGGACGHGAGCLGAACLGCGCLGGCGGDGGVHSPGPATGQITYPYYTLRGPRDFLARSPRPIGP
jgi:hypothetical protein